MTDIAARYRRLATAFRDRIAVLTPDQWDAPTPCEEWDVRALVAHVVGAHEQFEALVGRTLAAGTELGADPLAVLDAAVDQVAAELADDRGDVAFDGHFGRMTFAEAVDGFVSWDLVIHGWDLATAAGQDAPIDPADVAFVRDGVAGFGPALHSPGVCGPALDAPADADAQTRLLAELGRRAW